MKDENAFVIETMYLKFISQMFRVKKYKKKSVMTGSDLSSVYLRLAVNIKCKFWYLIEFQDDE